MATPAEEPSHIEHNYHAECANKECVLDINLPRTNGFFYNSRHQRLHFRMFYQHNRPIKSLIVYLHGYSRHCHNPHLLYMAEHAVDSHCAIVFLDFHGHGYSEGLKAYVEHPEDLVDDATSLLDYLYDEHVDLNRCDFNSHPSSWREAAPTFDPYYSLIANQVPFYVFGMSMGGGTALQLGLNLQKQKHAYSHLFKGCILLAPAIETKMPSALTTFVFETLMVPWFPDACMPAAVGGKDHEAVWDSEHFIEYVAVKDHYDPENNPHGMSFNNPIRYRTASSILKLMGGVMDNIDTISYPFIVFHDPEDNVTMFSGSARLHASSATPHHQKKLVAMPNARHDLIINRLAYVVDQTFEWIASHNNCHWKGPVLATTTFGPALDIRALSPASSSSAISPPPPPRPSPKPRAGSARRRIQTDAAAAPMPAPARVRIRRAK